MAVARKLLVVRAGLMRLEMAEDLTHIVRGGTVRPIAPVEEVQALQRSQPGQYTDHCSVTDDN